MNVLLWMARSLMLSLMIGAAAHWIESAMRGRSTGTRWVWAVALLLSVTLPLVTIVPGSDWPSELRSPSMFAVMYGPVVASDGPADVQSSASDPVVVHDPVTAGTQSEQRNLPQLLWIWAAASLFCLLRYLHGWMRLTRARWTWRPSSLVGDAVMISDDLGPAVVGLFRPHLVLPAWVMTAPAERQRMIVQHELEHVRARDHVVLAAAPLLAIIFPWNLVLWWQLRRFRLAVECDCDARVLKGGARRADYGAMLLDIATTRISRNPGLAGLVEPRSLLRRRIEAMKEGQFRKSLARVVLLQSAAAGALFSALLLTLPPSAPVQAQSGGRVEQAPRTGDLLYVVDGKVIGQRASLDAAALGVDVGKITVLTPAAARARYGAQGANGAVVITTQRPAIPARPSVPPVAPTPVVPPQAVVVDVVVPDTARAAVVARAVRPDTVSLRVRPVEPGSDPVIYVDGVRLPEPLRPLIIIDGRVIDAAVRDLKALIDPSTIDHIEVIKGSAAVQQYGERARDGVIVITSKRK